MLKPRTQLTIKQVYGLLPLVQDIKEMDCAVLAVATLTNYILG